MIQKTAIVRNSNSQRGQGRFHWNLSFGTPILLALLVISTLFTLAHSSQPTKASTSFSFTAAGDHGQTNYTTANLNYIAKSGVSFHLALGDFNYSKTSNAQAWSTYVKSSLPSNFPFEIVAGGHDGNSINTYATDLPDHTGSVSGTYAKQYSFDYPPHAPLARFIVISPSNVLSGYSYNKGSANYNWVANTIDGARKANIHWVVVGMHEFCFVIGTSACPGQALLDLLLNKHVDLILQAQKHDFQVSKQLTLNSKTCPTLPITNYNANCVVNSTKSLTKGVGSVIVVTGTGGTTPLLSIDTSDPKIGYFRNWMGANVNPTWGVSQFTVSATKLTMQFVAVSGGTFSDSFTITG